MELLIDLSITALCAFVGWLFWAFQHVARDCGEGRFGELERKRFPWLFAGCVSGSTLLAFSLAAHGTLRIVEELGRAGALSVFTVPCVALYGVWLWGWAQGREERRSMPHR